MPNIGSYPGLPQRPAVGLGNQQNLLGAAGSANPLQSPQNLLQNPLQPQQPQQADIASVVMPLMQMLMQMIQTVMSQALGGGQQNALGAGVAGNAGGAGGALGAAAGGGGGVSYDKGVTTQFAYGAGGAAPASVGAGAAPAVNPGAIEASANSPQEEAKLQQSLAAIAADPEGARLLEEAQKNGVSISVGDTGGPNILGFFRQQGDKKDIVVGDGANVKTIVHELVHAATYQDGNSQHEEGIANIIGERVAARIDGRQGPNARQVYNSTLPRYQELSRFNAIESSLGRLGIVA